MIELARRSSGSLSVALLWKRETDVFAVSVDDAWTGRKFELVVAGERPLDIYHHPYAYAAFRGIDYGVAA
jgi:hypothetical protein